MGVGLVRSLQPPDILWIHWRVYNFIANTNKGVLFLPPSDAYVRSFLYLLYTLIKLYYTKALNDQGSSLAPDWTLILWGPRIPTSWFNNNISVWRADSIEKTLMLGKIEGRRRRGRQRMRWLAGIIDSMDVSLGLLRVPWTARRSSQSILKEISPGISLEGMTLKLKL